jgi:hypothetical protein
MGDSLADWLALREPFDAAARSAVLTRAIADALPRGRVLKVVDLGTGTGSNVRYLTGRLPPPQAWLLVDQDAALLADVPQAMFGALDPRCEIETHRMNLGTLDSAIFEGRHLVTASALLDLASETWLRSLAAHCHAAGAAGLFALTYIGASRCSPVEPEDDAVRDLMNRHQRANDKGFGRAAGPDAVDAAERAFAGVGYRVQSARSDWVLPPEARALQRQLVDGWAEAASEIAPEHSPMIRNWLSRRLAHIDAGRSRIMVCHEDLAAWPPGSFATTMDMEDAEVRGALGSVGSKSPG